MKSVALSTLATLLGSRLQSRGLFVTTAESCTGGGVAVALTDIAGSSAWFERGFITYSNSAKLSVLGVDVGILATHGAVSEATAAQMARGALAASASDWAIAVTGIAGPGGGVPDKPVGTVCFAWTGPQGITKTETGHFAGDRQRIRRQSVEHALRGLLERLETSG